jgi:hypothetical protein
VTLTVYWTGESRQQFPCSIWLARKLGSEHTATQGAFSPAYDFSHLTSLQRMRRPAGWHTWPSLSGRIVSCMPRAPVPGGKLDFRTSGLASILCPPSSTSRALHRLVRNPSGLRLPAHFAFGQITINYSVGSTAARVLHPEPSYRHPSHSGWPAYAPVDLPTPSSSGLAALVCAHDIGYRP